MAQKYTAVVKKDDGWWIGWIEEVPGVNCQERTREGLIETLKLTLAEALDLNRAEARSAAGSGFEELEIAV
jgi:predicted RNase H-like HicB family nuclease